LTLALIYGSIYDMNIFSKLREFLKEVALEMRKVNWPTAREAFKHTLTIVIISLVVAAFLGGLDYIFSTILNTYII